MWDWLNCVIFLRHEYGIWCEDGAIFLRCVRCGHRSAGWDVENHHHGSGEPEPARARAPQRFVRRHA